MRRHDRGHNDDIGDLTDLCRLDVDDGGSQPASVTGVVVGAEGNQKQQQEEVEGHQQVAVLRHDFHIDGRNKGKGDDANERRADLNGDVTEVTAEFGGGGGTADDDTAKGRSNEAQKKQYPVALSGEILQLGYKLIQGPASFLSADYSIIWEESKLIFCEYVLNGGFFHNRAQPENFLPTEDDRLHGGKPGVCGIFRRDTGKNDGQGRKNVDIMQNINCVKSCRNIGK